MADITISTIPPLPAGVVDLNSPEYKNWEAQLRQNLNAFAVSPGANITVTGGDTVALQDNPVFTGTEAVTIVSGTTAQRPGTPATGDTRINTTTGNLEVYIGGTWANVVFNTTLDISADTSPVLGGNLDVDGNSIVSTSNGNIAITANGSGTVTISSTSGDITLNPGSGNTNITNWAPSGDIQLGNNSLVGGTATIADDAATNFTPTEANGIIMIHETGSASYGAIISYKVGSGAYVLAMSNTGFTIDTGTALTGTDGTDTEVTVRAGTDGKFYIENRSGAQRVFSWVLLSQ